jgi:hypothetical protein
VTMKNVVLWGVTPYGSCKNRRFGGTYLSVLRSTVTHNVVPSSSNLVIKMEGYHLRRRHSSFSICLWYSFLLEAA